MRIFSKKWISCVLLVLLCVLGISSSAKEAEAVFVVKVPLQTRVYVNGVELPDSSILKIDLLERRIDKMATEVTGKLYGTKQYLVTNLPSLDCLAVYDGDKLLNIVSTDDAMTIDYTGNEIVTDQSIVQRVHDSAVGFHNRTQYGTDKGFSNCFRKGSTAYNNAVNSDAGRKWGQFFTPGGLTNVDVKEIYQYSDDIMSAKVTLKSQESKGYVDEYDLYLLFQKFGNQFFATNFTYQQ